MALKLIDRLGRKLNYVRISVTDRCNYRCRYCMPEEGVEWIPHDKIMTYEEIRLLIQLLMELGVKSQANGRRAFRKKGFCAIIANLAPVLSCAGACSND